jgi:hypothetical protein
MGLVGSFVATAGCLPIACPTRATSRGVPEVPDFVGAPRPMKMSACIGSMMPWPTKRSARPLSAAWKRASVSRRCFLPNHRTLGNDLRVSAIASVCVQGNWKWLAGGRPISGNGRPHPREKPLSKTRLGRAGMSRPRHRNCPFDWAALLITRNRRTPIARGASVPRPSLLQPRPPVEPVT